MRTVLRQGPEIWIRGPVGEPEPDPPEFAHAQAVTRRFSWGGLQGSAGVATLAAVHGDHDNGRAWPGPAGPQPVLLVARTHASGLETVVPAVEMFRRGEVPYGLALDAVVLVADAPGCLPRSLAQRIRYLESVADVYRVPWVPAWRLGDLGGRRPREAGPLARLTGSMR
ncbi:DUF6668 family protein [Streptomyces sp. KMM 9044]|uniref:DUF6668 family protein n=1 Tax=Streptomyces sp. KMM 9044 TaxID=2744474 RepID=UPI002150A97F|nr:DUF6668 family protein [Streptomyces sp. KMM 9044]WAX78530.1 hypothetical protein HUV60_013425 [Streptomyces sp. KMM 9044]